MRSLQRTAAEDLLFLEADLLDQWRLTEWLTLLTDDVGYLVPPCHLSQEEAEAADPRSTLFLIADDARRIRARVKRLLSTHAHAENPHSRTRRHVTNVRVSAADDESAVVTANFTVHRIRYETIDTYMGRYVFKLREAEGALRIQERKAILDLQSLSPMGTISFIL